MAYPLARRRPSQIARECGFGRLYNVRNRPKQASFRHGPKGSPGFASAACGAYLGAAERSDPMSAAEQLDDGRGKAPPHPRDALMEAEAVIEAQLEQSPAAGRARLRPLLALAP